MKIYLQLALSLFFINIFYSKANIVVNNSLTHHFKIEKNNIYKGTIELQNIGKENKTAKLYLQDVSYHSNGTTIYSSPGTNELTNSNWLELNSNLIELKPGEKFEVKFEVKIPNDEVKPGSYSSILMIEPIEIFTTNSTENKGIHIQSIIRYAVQIIADYDVENVKANLKFESINIDYNNEERILKIALENKGLKFCQTTIYLEMYDFATSTKIDVDLKSQSMGLLPNTSKSYTIDISKLKKGKYKTVAFAKDDQENIFAIEFELDV